MTYNIEAAHKALLNKTPSGEGLFEARKALMDDLKAAAAETRMRYAADEAFGRLLGYEVSLASQYHYLTWGDARDGEDWYTLYRRDGRISSEKTPLITFNYLETEKRFVLPQGDDPLEVLVEKLFKRAEL